MICVLVGTHSCGGKCNIFKSLYVWSESPSIHRHDVVVLLSADTVYVYIFHLSLFFSQRMFVGETLAIFHIYIYIYTLHVLVHISGKGGWCMVVYRYLHHRLPPPLYNVYI